MLHPSSLSPPYLSFSLSLSVVYHCLSHPLVPNPFSLIPSTSTLLLSVALISLSYLPALSVHFLRSLSSLLICFSLCVFITYCSFMEASKEIPTVVCAPVFGSGLAHVNYAFRPAWSVNRYQTCLERSKRCLIHQLGNANCWVCLTHTDCNHPHTPLK